MPRRKKRIGVYVAVAAVVLGGLILLYWWMQADPRLQPNTSEKEVAHILASEGTTVALPTATPDLPYAKYYVALTVCGTGRIRQQPRRDGVLRPQRPLAQEYEVTPLARSRPNWLNWW